MSQLPNAQQCKANAINALARIVDLDPEITGEPRDGVMEQQLIGIAQVWATLATVPDDIIEVRQAPPNYLRPLRDNPQA